MIRFHAVQRVTDESRSETEKPRDEANTQVECFEIAAKEP